MHRVRKFASIVCLSALRCYACLLVAWPPSSMLYKLGNVHVRQFVVQLPE